MGQGSLYNQLCQGERTDVHATSLCFTATAQITLCASAAPCKYSSTLVSHHSLSSCVSPGKGTSKAHSVLYYYSQAPTDQYNCKVGHIVTSEKGASKLTQVARLYGWLARGAMFYSMRVQRRQRHE